MRYWVWLVLVNLVVFFSGVVFGVEKAVEKELNYYKEADGRYQIRKAEEGSLTPLLRAIREKKSLEEIKEIINNRADVNAQDSNGNTALFYSIFYDVDYALISYLLFHGADMDLMNFQDDYFVNYKMREKFSTEKQAKIYWPFSLIQYTAEPADVMYEEEVERVYKPVDVREVAEELELIRAIMEVRGVEEILGLIRETEDLDAQDCYGNTALHYALSLPEPERVVFMLIGRGASPIIKNKQGNTARSCMNDGISEELDHALNSLPRYFDEEGEVKIDADSAEFLHDMNFKLLITCAWIAGIISLVLFKCFYEMHPFKQMLLAQILATFIFIPMYFILSPFSFEEFDALPQLQEQFVSGVMGFECIMIMANGLGAVILPSGRKAIVEGARKASGKVTEDEE